MFCKWRQKIFGALSIFFNQRASKSSVGNNMWLLKYKQQFQKSTTLVAVHSYTNDCLLLFVLGSQNKYLVNTFKVFWFTELLILPSWRKMANFCTSQPVDTNSQSHFETFTSKLMFVLIKWWSTYKTLSIFDGQQDLSNTGDSKKFKWCLQIIYSNKSQVSVIGQEWSTGLTKRFNITLLFWVTNLKYYYYPIWISGVYVC